MRDIVRIYGLITMSSVLQGSIKPISGTRGGDKKKKKKKKKKLRNKEVIFTNLVSKG